MKLYSCTNCNNPIYFENSTCLKCNPATSHLWEDWAKTWAHYMRMIDTLKTTCSFGIDIKRAEMKTLSIMIPTSQQILTISSTDGTRSHLR